MLWGKLGVWGIFNLGGAFKARDDSFFKDHGLGDPFSGWNWLLFKRPKPTFYDKVIFKIDQLFKIWVTLFHDQDERELFWDQDEFFKIWPTQPKDQPPLYYQKDQDQGTQKDQDEFLSRSWVTFKRSRRLFYHVDGTSFPDHWGFFRSSDFLTFPAHFLKI